MHIAPYPIVIERTDERHARFDSCHVEYRAQFVEMNNFISDDVPKWEATSHLLYIKWTIGRSYWQRKLAVNVIYSENL